MIKVSVIVPVHNAERYLVKCIESLLNQTLEEMEIILIDDASTDSSGKICDEYAILHNNVRVLHINEKSVASARNAGIQVAAGEYIGFVDSDDYVHQDMFGAMYKEAISNDCDMVFCNTNEVDVNGSILNKRFAYLPVSMDISNADMRTYLCQVDSYKLLWFVCKSIFRRDLIVDNEISFLNGNIGEDTLFNLETILCSNKSRFINEYYYNYVQTPNSIIRGGYKDKFYEHLNNAYIDRKRISEKHNLKDYQSSLCDYSMSHSIIMLLSNEIKNTSNTKERIDTLRSIRNTEIVDEAFKYSSVFVIRNRIKWVVLLLKYRCYSLVDYLLHNLVKR